MSLKIDESVKIKQREWSHLLDVDELNVPVLPPCPLPINKQLFLATVWLKDAVKGRNVDFPQTEFQLTCYYLTRSHKFLILYTFICFIHMLLPFLEQPFCAWSSNGYRNYDYNNPPFDSHYLSPHASAIIGFFCLLFYLLEIYMRLCVNVNHRNQRALDFWTKVRGVFVLLMLIDSLHAMISYRPQVSRALLPMIYITRRKSLRQMTFGLLIAASKCSSVFILLICILLAWSYLGSLIFGQVELDVSGRFGSFIQSFLTTLESYSCRGYIIFALDPLFTINPGSATFFVTLSIFADILCSALIVATGTRQYQLYAAKIFKKELLNRKQSMLAVFGVLYHCSEEYKEKEKSLSLSRKISDISENNQDDIRNSPSISTSRSTSSASTSNNEFVRSFSLDHLMKVLDLNSVINQTNQLSSSPPISQPSLSISHQNSFNNISELSLFSRQTLYDPRADKNENKKQYISKHVWLEFCSVLSGRYEVSPELALMLYHTEVLPGEKGLTREGLFNLAALLDGQIKIEGALPEYLNTLENNENNGDNSDGNNGNNGNGNGNGNKDNNNITNNNIENNFDRYPSKDEIGQDEPYNIRKQSLSERLRGIKQQKNNDEEFGILLSTIKEDYQGRSKVDFTNKKTTNINILTRSGFKTYMKILKFRYSYICNEIIKTSITIPYNIPLITNSMNEINYFESIVFIARILLIIQLVYLSIPSSSKGWIYFGWFLEMIFWLEMFIRIGSSAGWSIHHYLRLFSINIITLSLMISVHAEKKQSGQLIALLCFQWIRLIRVFLPFNASKALRSLLPLLFRVLFLVFTVIYFFANIGYYRFCGSFNTEKASEVDDWAGRWVPYDHQLNFNTMAQTMYTLFQVAILGNWSFVMGAVMLECRAPAAIYFYSYRLLMTLVVLPILTSFIIQAYNARNSKIDEMEQNRKLYLEELNKQKNEIIENNNMNNNNIDGNNSNVNNSNNNDGNGSINGMSNHSNSILSTIYEDGEPQRVTQGSSVTLNSMDSVSRPKSSSLSTTTVITRAEDTENSMISFWSGSGNENYFNAPQKQLTKNNLSKLDETSEQSNQAKDDLMERYQSLLESVEVYKLATNVLMKENQELKIQIKLLKNEIEIDENEVKDFTD